MGAYVDIVRHFRSTTEDAVPSGTRRLLRSLRPDAAPTWDSLLNGESAPIVLLAPSGTGKTTELKQQAARMRGAQLVVIYAEAASIVDGIEGGLWKEEHDVFVQWMRGTEPAVLFIDAVDELHRQQRKLGDLLRRLGREIDLTIRPLRLVLSARNGTWTRAATGDLVRLVGGTEEDSVKLVTFEPIDDAAIRKLAAEQDVPDVEAFMQAFKEDEVDGLLDLRPSDVGFLVRQWRSQRQLGRWSKVLDDIVRESFTEEDPERARTRSTTAEEGRKGLERIAAATGLMGAPHVSVPTAAVATGTVSSRRLLEDWPIGKLTELFENPLFVHKGRDAEAVQLPQGPVSYFLAARWMAARVECGWPAEMIRDALLVRVFDEKHYRIPAVHREMIGWIASEVPAFRTMLAGEHPHIVLYEGDPERLADAEVRAALRILCADLASKGTRDVWPTAATLRKVARPAMEPEVASLLGQYSSSDAVQRHLLRYVQAGRYTSCVEAALRVALDPSRDAHTRCVAMRAIASAGDDSHRAALLPLVSTDADDIRAALLRALVPGVLQGADLADFISNGGGHTFRFELSRVVQDMSAADVDLALQRLLARLKKVNSHDVVDESVKDLEVVIPLLLARFEQEQPVPAVAIQALTGIERLDHHVDFYLSQDDRTAFDIRLQRDENARRALWAERLAAARANPRFNTPVFQPILGEARTDDIEWLFAVRAENDLAGFVLRRVWDRLAPHERSQVRGNDSLSADVRDLLAGYQREDDDVAKRRQKYSRDERRKESAERKKTQRAIESRRAEIESGDDLGSLIWAWQQLGGPSSERIRLDPARLRSLVDEEHVQVLLRGMQACWRKQDVAPPVPESNQTLLRYLVGLVGITLEVRAGLRFSTLSSEDATRAARYALYELNSFPFWLPDLLDAHPEPVVLALRGAIAAEWDFSGEKHGVLRFASHANDQLARAMREIVLELLRSRAPAHQRTAEYAVDALLTSTAERYVVARLARREVERGGDTPARSEWLRLWAHVEPEAAARWLRHWTRGDPARQEVLLHTLSQLEQDLDERRGRVGMTWLAAPSALAEWIRLVLPIVRFEDDLQHRGVHVVGVRDHAQQFRDRCLNRIAADPSPEADHTLRTLMTEPGMAAFRGMLDRLSSQQRAGAAEAAVLRWTEDDLLRIERGDERTPSSLEHLFDLVCSHIAHVGRLIENDDFGYRGVFSNETNETEIQRWAASCLRERAKGLYSVVRENVVGDGGEVDISAFAAGIGNIPIEIKPLGPYSPKRLERVIEQRLLGQYMQPPDRRCGVLLLVRRDRLRWRLGGKTRGLPDLVAHLQGYARALGLKSGKSIRVEMIDLLQSASSVPTSPTSTGIGRGKRARLPSGSRPTRGGRS